MTPEENKERIRRYLEGAWNEGNVSIADEVFAPDIRSHSPYAEFTSLDQEKEYVSGVKEVLPDFHTNIDDMIAEGDKVVVRGHDTFTHNARFFGNQPTGNKVEVSWIVIYQFKNGKVVEKWIEQDMMSLMQQLGAKFEAKAA